ncbi:MAG TPA: hypothetical protein VK901_19365 [Nitrospiraceae bacterium]|nr:hypothetical protein [Nitrospiraceae bacterium]
MDTYYRPQDLGKFAETGKSKTDLWDKFMRSDLLCALTQKASRLLDG